MQPTMQANAAQSVIPLIRPNNISKTKWKKLQRQQDLAVQAAVQQRTQPAAPFEFNVANSIFMNEIPTPSAPLLKDLDICNVANNREMPTPSAPLLQDLPPSYTAEEDLPPPPNYNLSMSEDHNVNSSQPDLPQYQPYVPPQYQPYLPPQYQPYPPPPAYNEDDEVNDVNANHNAALRNPPPAYDAMIEDNGINPNDHDLSHSMAYNLANRYVNAAEIMANRTKIAGRAMGRFSYAFARTSATAWNLGGQQCAKEIVKASIGTRHYQDALDTVKNSWGGRIQSRAHPDEQMGLAEAFGEASAHVVKGLTKVAVSAASLGTTGLYAWGTVSNSFKIKPETMTIHQAASILATGVNGAGNVVLTVASNTVMPLMKGVLLNPATTARYGVTALGMGTCLYAAASHFTKAVDAEGVLPKVMHGVIAGASLAATVALPYFISMNT